MKTIGNSPVVLQVLPELRSGGVERGTIEIAKAIADEGWVSLVASQGGPMVPQLAYAGAEHIELPLRKKSYGNIKRNARRLEHIIKKYDVDIVHARSRGPAWSAYLAAKNTKRAFVTTFHGTYGTKNWFKRWYNSVMTRGERVIAISNFISKHIQWRYGVKQDSIRLIHRGVDLKLFNPDVVIPQRMIDLLGQWRIVDEEKPIILMPGRITRWKGQDIVLKALEQLDHRNFYCVLLGDDADHPAYREELDKLIDEYGMEEQIRIAPNTTYMAEAYHLAQVVLCPSLEPEAFGRIAIEAQALGKPVIAANHGGARETVLPNITGWLVEPGNIDQLAEAIKIALALDDESKANLAFNARQNAEQVFSLDKMKEKTLAVYHEVLGGK
jgi:glycosyltransferase involved in cell wall biosynthesis